MRHDPIRAAAAAAALALAAAPAAQAEELRMAIGSAGTSALADGMQRFGELLETATEGAYTTKFYQGTLLSYAEAPTGVRDGIADIAFVVPAYARAEFPNTNLPLDMSTATNSLVVMAAATTEFVFTCEPCLQEFRDYNQVFMGFSGIGPYYLMSVDRVDGLDDFAGRTFRGYGPFARWVEAMGATSVLVGAADVFESISQGQIDGNTHTMDVLRSLSLGEVTDYVLDAPIGVQGGNALFNTNRDVWESMSAEHKRAFLDAAGEAHAWTTVEYDKRQQPYFEDPSQVGVELVSPDAELTAAHERFRKQDLETVADLNVEYGIEDAHDQVDRMKALVAKWTELVSEIDETDPDAVAELYREELYSKIDPASL